MNRLRKKVAAAKAFGLGLALSLLSLSAAAQERTEAEAADARRCIARLEAMLVESRGHFSDIKPIHTMLNQPMCAKIEPDDVRGSSLFKGAFSERSMTRWIGDEPTRDQERSFDGFQISEGRSGMFVFLYFLGGTKTFDHQRTLIGRGPSTSAQSQERTAAEAADARRCIARLEQLLVEARGNLGYIKPIRETLNQLMCARIEQDDVRESRMFKGSFVERSSIRHIGRRTIFGDIQYYDGLRMSEDESTMYIVLFFFGGTRQFDFHRTSIGRSRKF